MSALLEARHVFWTLGTERTHAALPESITSVLGDAGASAEAQRAALLQLQDHIHSLFVYRFPPNFFWQMGAAAVVLIVYILLGAYIVISRLMRRNFWLVKVMRKPDGSYLVPNALNSFLIFEGIFAGLWIVLTLIVYLTYERRIDYFQSSIIGISAGCWGPMILGATFCGWGTFYTAPGALDRSFNRTLTTKTRFGFDFKLRTLVINLLALGMPVLLIISVTIPLGASQYRLNKNFFGVYIPWSDALLSAAHSASNTPVPQEQIAAWLQSASTIWQEQAETLGLLGVCFILWGGWAGLFVIFYFFAAGFLVIVLFKQLRIQRKLLREIADEDARQEKEAIGLQVAHLTDRPGNNTTAADTKGETAEYAVLSQLSKSPVSPTWDVRRRSSTGSSVHTKEVFFPRIQEDAQKRATKRLNVRASPTSRFRHLRRCFFTLTVLYVGVIMGAMLYCIIASRLGANFYSAALAGPDALTHLVYTSHLPAAWGAVLFGSLTFLSIAFRELDPASAPQLAEDTPGPSRLSQTLRGAKRVARVIDGKVSDMIASRKGSNAGADVALPPPTGSTFRGETSRYEIEQDPSAPPSRRQSRQPTTSGRSVDLPRSEPPKPKRARSKSHLTIFTGTSAFGTGTDPGPGQSFSLREDGVACYATPYGPMQSILRQDGRGNRKSISFSDKVALWHDRDQVTRSMPGVDEDFEIVAIPGRETPQLLPAKIAQRQRSTTSLASSSADLASTEQKPESPRKPSEWVLRELEKLADEEQLSQSASLSIRLRPSETDLGSSTGAPSMKLRPSTSTPSIDREASSTPLRTRQSARHITQQASSDSEAAWRSSSNAGAEERYSVAAVPDWNSAAEPTNRPLAPRPVARTKIAPASAPAPAPAPAPTSSQ